MVEQAERTAENLDALADVLKTEAALTARVEASLCMEKAAKLVRQHAIGTDTKLLSDPTAVMLNMMRGTIAKPELSSLSRLYPEVAELVEALEKIVRGDPTLESAEDQAIYDLGIARDALARYRGEA